MNLTEVIENMWVLGTFSELAVEISTDSSLIKELFELTNNAEHKVAWRSAYLFDQVNDLAPHMIVPYISQIINRLPKVTDQSVKRHYARILTQHDINELADGPLVDCCFKWLLQEETPIAVKAHLMQILFNLTQVYPELGTELKTVLEEVIPMGSTGVKNRARKILAKLNKQGPE